ncbi:MAG: tRNA lysidine(34) synthetase TilS [Gammaproteobacteria bacterium]
MTAASAASPLAATLAARLAALAAASGPRRRLVVGVSGGVDSLLLLDLLHGLSPLPLLAVHVHHGLSPRAGEWAAQVDAFCRARQLPCTVLPVTVDRAQPSLEAAARDARHAAFATVLQPGDALLLAHHADDQAETLLLRLLRGSGPGGLGAMREARRLPAPEDCWLWRPLLAVRREAIVAAAQARGLHWIDDESNENRAMDRNFLRHEVLPALAGRWPAAVDTLVRTARRLAESDALLNEYVDAELASLLHAGSGLDGPRLDDTGGRDGLDAAQLVARPPARQRALLRRWLARIGAPRFSEAWLEQLAALAAARVDAEGELRVAGWELHRYRGVLVAFPALPPPVPARVLAWGGQGSLDLGPGHGRLLAVAAGDPGALALALPPGEPLTVRFRAGGERLAPAGGNGHRPLKKALQDAGVPPWLRERLPLVYAGDRLASVADRIADAAFAPAADRPATHWLRWQS